MITSKKCSLCGAEKPLEEFSRDKSKKYGVGCRCKVCDAARNLKYYHDNQELCNKKQNIRRKANPEKARVACRKWYAENTEKELARCNEYKKENSEKIKARERKYRTDNAEKICDYKKEYRQENKEQIAEYSKKYRQENPDLFNAHCAKRRTAKKQAIPSWADLSLIKVMYTLAKQRTILTSVEHCIDHIIPLQHRLVCGLHTNENLQIISAEANRKKKNSFWPDMPD